MLPTHLKGSRTRWIPFYTPQPDFRSAFLFLKTQKNRRNSCHSLPRNRSFLWSKRRRNVSFDWNERANEWKDIQRARYLNLPHIASEEELETLLSKPNRALYSSIVLHWAHATGSRIFRSKRKRISPFPGEQGVTGDSRLCFFVLVLKSLRNKYGVSSERDNKF